MTKEKIAVLAAIVTTLVAVAALWYARQQTTYARQEITYERQQIAQQKRQAHLLAVTAVQGVSRGMPTFAQTAWLPAGEELGVINRAVGDLDAVIAIESTETSAYIARGVCLARLGNYEAAFASYQRAIELCGSQNKCTAVVLNDIGDVYAEQCQLKQAEEKYRQSLRTHYSILATANLAECLLEQNRVDEAHHEILGIIDADPNFVGTHLVYGKILWRRNQRQEAIKQFERAVQIDPRYQPETHLELSKAYLASDNTPDALAEASAAIVVAPNFAEAHAWYAEVLEKAGTSSVADSERRKAKALMARRKPHTC
jgi:tetratricopeptide (TPR) repeat protein